MSAKYGFNINASDIKSVLFESDRQKNGVNSWKQLFSGASQNYAMTNDALVKSYSDTVAQAYKANMAQRDAIAAAGLSAGVTGELMNSNREALHSAYQTYIQNYNQGATANAQNYSDTIGAYDKDLTARATNFSKLYNYAYQYLTDELGTSVDKDNVSWLTKNNLDWLADEDGSVVSWETLSQELFDENRQLTEKGREFFDAMFNAQTADYLTEKGEATRGFDKWLSETDSELRDWYMQGDVYNSTDKGTNLGTAKQLLGLESTDEAYSQSEYGYHGENVLTEAAKFSFNLTDDELEKIDKVGKNIDKKEDKMDRLEGKKIKGGINWLRRTTLGERIKNKTDKIDDYLIEYADAYTNQIAKVNAEMKKMIGDERYKEFTEKYATDIKALEDEIAKVKNPSNRNLITDKTIETKYADYIALWQKFLKGEDTEDTEDT